MTLVEGPGSITGFFDALRAGDAAAVGPLWERFFPRLLALARHTLAGRPQRVADADDAVQSAFATFWQRAARGGFGEHLDRDDLWNLLGVITVRKAQRQVRREGAERRGGGQVVGEDRLTFADGTPLPLDEAVGRLLAADFDLTSAEMLAGLGDDLRPFAVLRLLGYRNREIADAMDCTERKVERKLNLIRMRWER